MLSIRDCILVAALLGLWTVALYSRVHVTIPDKQKEIVFVARDLSKPMDASCLAYLEYLVQQHNVRAPIKLHVRVLDSKAGSRTAALYTNLAKEEPETAIIDNSWGQDIDTCQREISALSSPVVFMNADRNEVDYGRARLFLGSNDQVPARTVKILNQELRDIKTALVFVSEREYGLSKRFTKELSESLDPTLFDKMRHVEVSGTMRISKRRDLHAAKEQIRSAFAETSSEARKIVLLNTHSAWGTELLRWIGSEFENVTVIGHQAVLAKEREVTFQRISNELIIFGQAEDLVYDALHRDRKRLVSLHPTLFGRDDDIFFMRRVKASFLLIVRGLETAGEFATDSERFVEEMSNAVEDCRGRSVETPLGLLTFDANGVEQGNDRIVYRRNSRSVSYPQQLNSKNELVPNIQFGIRDLSVSDIDVRRATFKAGFIFWVRCGKESFSKIKTKASDIPSQITEMLQIGDRANEEFDQHLLAEQNFGSISEYTFSVRGVFRLKKPAVFWYPFDSQTPSIHVRLALPEAKIQASAEKYDLNRGTVLDGWDVMDASMTFESVSIRQDFVPNQFYADREANQYKQCVFSMSVRRQLWGAFALIFVPLFFATVASISVLFIRLSPSQVPPPHDPEVLKIKCELTLVCLIAVLTALVSYSEIAPRTDQPLYSDLLVGLSLVITTTNFLFVVVVAMRDHNRVWRMLSVQIYRQIVAATAILAFGVWWCLGLAR